MEPFQASLSSIEKNSLLTSKLFYESMDNILSGVRDLDEGLNELNDEFQEENFLKFSSFSHNDPDFAKFLPLDQYKTYFVTNIFKNEIKKFFGNIKLRIARHQNGILFSQINASMEQKFAQLKKYLDDLEIKVVVVHQSCLNGVKFFIARRESKGFHFFFKCKDYMKHLWDVIFVFQNGISINEKNGCLKIIENIEKQKFYLNALFFDYKEAKLLSMRAKNIEKIEILNICKLSHCSFEYLRKKGTLNIFKESETSWNLPKTENQNIIFMNDVLFCFPKKKRVSNYLEDLKILKREIEENKLYFSFEICDTEMKKEDQQHYPSGVFKALEQNENFVFFFAEFLKKICFLIHEKRLEKNFLKSCYYELSELRRKKKCSEEYCFKNDLKNNLYVTKIIVLKKCFYINSKKNYKEIEKFYEKKKNDPRELKIDKSIKDWECSEFLFINAINITFCDAWKFLIKLLKNKEK